jgi:hypothetical protein
VWPPETDSSCASVRTWGAICLACFNIVVISRFEEQHDCRSDKLKLALTLPLNGD